MIFTPTNDNLSPRESWQNSYYNDLIDDLQAKALASGDFDYPFVFGGSISLGGSSLFNIGNFGSDTSSNDNAIRIANGLDMSPSNSPSDNRSAFQTIIDGLSSNGEIVLGPGTYTINATVVLNGSSDDKGNYTIRGSGRGVTIIQASSTFTGNDVLRFTNTTATQTSTGIILKDLTVDAKQSAGRCVNMRSTIDCQLHNIETKNADDTTVNGDGVYLANADGATLFRVYSNSNDGHGIRSASDASGTLVSCEFIHCLAEGNGIDGFHMEPPGNYCSFDHCRASTNGGSGFLFEAVVSEDSDGLTVSNCIAFSNTADGFQFVNDAGGSGTFFGIGLCNCLARRNDDHGYFFDAGTTSDVLNHWSILGCRAIANDKNGLFIYRNVVDGAITGGIYANNNVEGNGTADDSNGIAIDLEDSGQVDGYITITGANVSATSDQRIGLLLTANSDACIVQGCAGEGNSTSDITDSGGVSNDNFTTQDTSTPVEVTNYFGSGP